MISSALRHGTPWLGFALILAGCTQYQYAIVQSTLPQTEKREFVAGNDSVEVRYNFGGYYGPIKITAHNKLDTPLYIDWKKSSIIVDGIAHSYWEDKARIDATADRDLRQDASLIQEVDIKGTVTRPDATSFLPPSASSTFEFKTLTQGRFNLDESIKGQREKTSTGNGPVTSTVYAFDRDNSPMTYRSYLSFAFADGAPPAFTLDDAFWVARVIKTHAAPRTFLKQPGGDTFYIPIVTGAGIVVGSAALTGIAALWLSVPGM